MKGYLKQPGRTAEAIDNEGWLHTGDILQRDINGYLRVLDRKEHLIVSTAGKAMSPAHIEMAIKAACPQIAALMVIGDGRPYNTAVIVLERNPVDLPHDGGGPLLPAASQAADPAVVAQIAAGVAAGNARLSSAEQVKRFRILPTYWDPGGDELTHTLKLRRRPIAAKYVSEIRELYAPEPAPWIHEPL